MLQSPQGNFCSLVNYPPVSTTKLSLHYNQCVSGLSIAINLPVSMNFYQPVYKDKVAVMRLNTDRD